jgi:hypothetical protein
MKTNKPYDIEQMKITYKNYEEIFKELKNL